MTGLFNGSKYKVKDNYKNFWEEHYTLGGNSGGGSYGEFAIYKANIVNSLLVQYDIETTIEFGCGDGNQLGLMNYANYFGVDVSQQTVTNCTKLYEQDSTKRFVKSLPGEALGESADLVVCLEVLFHVVDEEDFLSTLDAIFSHANKLVVIQTSLYPLIPYTEGVPEKHREVLPYLAKYTDFEIVDVVLDPSVEPNPNDPTRRLNDEIGRCLSDFVILRKK